MKRKIISFMAAVVLVSSCASNTAIKQTRNSDAFGDYYSDSFDPKTNRYENADIGFSLDFGNRWRVIEHYNDFHPSMKLTALQMRSTGLDMLLYAQSPQDLYAMRATVEPLDLPLEEYFLLIREINKKDLIDDRHQTEIINGKEMIKWTIDTQVQGRDFHFVEYLTKRGPYNLRLTFWTSLALGKLYEPRFRQVMETYSEQDHVL